MVFGVKGQLMHFICVSDLLFRSDYGQERHRKKDTQREVGV